MRRQLLWHRRCGLRGRRKMFGRRKRWSRSGGMMIAN